MLTDSNSNFIFDDFEGFIQMLEQIEICDKTLTMALKRGMVQIYAQWEKRGRFCFMAEFGRRNMQHDMCASRCVMNSSRQISGVKKGAVNGSPHGNPHFPSFRSTKIPSETYFSWQTRYSAFGQHPQYQSWANRFPFTVINKNLWTWNVKLNPVFGHEERLNMKEEGTMGGAIVCSLVCHGTIVHTIPFNTHDRQ